MVTRYERDDEVVPLALKRLARGVANANRATGTEIRQTADTAEQAATDSQFAKELAEQLEAELGPLPGQIQQALDDSAAALSEAGLAQTAAANAVVEAQQATADAAQAVADALAAAQAAANAQTSADGKSAVVRSPSAATAAGSYKQGDQWWQFSGGNIIGLWLHDGSSWVSQALTNAIIATLDAGKITTGTLAADRIGALSITTAKLAADSVTTAKIAALAVTAAELAANSVVATKIAASAVIAEKIASSAVTTDKLNALAVTAEKIAVGAIIAEKIAAGAITTGKLAATAIDGMTITGAVIRTAASGQRLQMDASGLRAYNSTGQNVATISSFGSGIMVDSVLSEYTQGISEMTGRNMAVRSKVTPYDRYIMFDYPPANDYGPSLLAQGIANGQKHRYWMQLSPWGANDAHWVISPNRMDTEPLSAGTIRFTAKTRFEQANEGRDRDWDYVNNTVPGAGLKAPFVHYLYPANPHYTGLQACIKMGVMTVTGAVRANSAYSGNAVVFEVPLAYAPEAAVIAPAWGAGSTFVIIDDSGKCIVAHGGNATGTLFFNLSWPLPQYYPSN